MKYNRNVNSKQNPRKFKKRWVVVPLAVLLSICGVSSITHANNAHASNLNNLANQSSNHLASQISQSNLKSASNSLVTSSSASANSVNNVHSSTVSDYASNASRIQTQAVNRAQQNMTFSFQSHHLQLGTTDNNHNDESSMTAKIPCTFNGQKTFITGIVNKRESLYNWAPHYAGYSIRAKGDIYIDNHSVKLTPSAYLSYMSDSYQQADVYLPVQFISDKGIKTTTNYKLPAEVAGSTGQWISLSVQNVMNSIPGGYKKGDSAMGTVYMSYQGPALVAGSEVTLLPSQVKLLGNKNSKPANPNKNSKGTSASNGQSSQGNNSKAAGSASSAKNKPKSNQSRPANSSNKSNSTDHNNDGKATSNQSSSQPNSKAAPKGSTSNNPANSSQSAGSKAASNGSTGSMSNKSAGQSQSAHSAKVPTSGAASSKGSNETSKVPSSQASAKPKSNASKPNDQNSSSASSGQPFNASGQVSGSGSSSEPSRANHSANSSSASAMPSKPTYGTVTVDYIDQNGQPVSVGNTQIGKDGQVFNLKDALLSVPQGYVVNNVADGANVRTFNNGNQAVVLTVSKVNSNQNSQNNSSNRPSITSNTNVTPQVNNHSNESLTSAINQSHSPIEQKSTSNPTGMANHNGLTQNASIHKDEPQSAKAQAAANNSKPQDPKVDNADAAANDSDETRASDPDDAGNANTSNQNTRSTDPVNDTQLGGQQGLDGTSVNPGADSDGTSNNSKLPQTGDATNPWVTDVSALLMLNAMLLGAFAEVRRRRN